MLILLYCKPIIGLACYTGPPVLVARIASEAYKYIVLLWNKLIIGSEEVLARSVYTLIDSKLNPFYS